MENNPIEQIKKYRKPREVIVEMEMPIEKQPFTEFMKKKMISTGWLIILLIITWICGFVWRGLYT